MIFLNDLSWLDQDIIVFTPIARIVFVRCQRNATLHHRNIIITIIFIWTNTKDWASAKHKHPFRASQTIIYFWWNFSRRSQGNAYTFDCTPVCFIWMDDQLLAGPMKHTIRHALLVKCTHSLRILFSFSFFGTHLFSFLSTKRTQIRSKVHAM